MKSFFRKIVLAVAALFTLSACSFMPGQTTDYQVICDKEFVVVETLSSSEFTFHVEDFNINKQIKLNAGYWDVNFDREGYKVDLVSLDESELKVVITNTDKNYGYAGMDVILKTKSGHIVSHIFDVYNKTYFDTAKVVEFQFNQVQDGRYCLSMQVVKMDKTPITIRTVHLKPQEEIAFDEITIENIYEDKIDYYFTPKGKGSDMIDVDIETVDHTWLGTGYGVYFE